MQTWTAPESSNTIVQHLARKYTGDSGIHLNQEKLSKFHHLLTEMSGYFTLFLLNWQGRAEQCMASHLLAEGPKVRSGRPNQNCAAASLLLIQNALYHMQILLQALTYLTPHLCMQRATKHAV